MIRGLITSFKISAIFIHISVSFRNTADYISTAGWADENHENDEIGKMLIAWTRVVLYEE
jgi:hypothetical protein